MPTQKTQSDTILFLGWALLAILAITMANSNRTLQSSVIPEGFSGNLELASYHDRIEPVAGAVANQISTTADSSAEPLVAEKETSPL